MANRYRGEIDAVLDGQRYTLCLTLGALAELEAAFGDEDMLALAERFSSGRLSARDAIRVLGAGLRGAGNDLCDEAVSRMRSDDGAAGFVGIVARLLNATFSEAQGQQAGSGPAAATQSAAAAHAEQVESPFPGPTP